MKRLLLIIPLMILLAFSSGCMTIKIPADKPPVIEKFTLDPALIDPGAGSILNWQVSNASAVDVQPGIGNAASSGAVKVSPAVSTSYTITANNKAGTSKSTLMLTVSAAAAPTVASNPAATIQPAGNSLPSITSFIASPSIVSSGGSATLSWTINNATGARINGYGNVNTTGSLVVYPSTTASYVIEAFNGVGSSSSSTVVTVVGGPLLYPTTPSSPPTGSRPAFVALGISPSTILAGGSATLSWDIYDATSIIIDNGIGSVGASGSRVISPSVTTTYTITAQNAWGTTIGSRVITVNAPVAVPTPVFPVVNDFHASSTTTTPGGEVKLYWSVSNAESIYIDHGVGSVSANGAQKVYPTTTTTYMLTATNMGNSTLQTVTITVR